MSIGTVYIHNDYSECEFLSDDNSDIIKIYGKNNIGKCFSGDIVKLHNEQLQLVKSNIQDKILVGILELYSSYKYGSTKKGIERFKFTPLQKEYPCFLVSSKCKSKYTSNVIVTIKYLEWESTLPYGEIIQYLGDIYNQQAIFESVLYKNNLVLPKYNLHKIQKQFKELTTENLPDLCKNMNNIINEHIISIDPPGTKDIDDCFHFKKKGVNHYLVGIHISNVIDMIHYLRIPFLLETTLISSVYAPHRIVNMFPNILSENYLSLAYKKIRLAVTLWIDIKNNHILNSSFERTIIQNKHNYSYDEYEKFLSKNKEHYDFFSCIQNLNYKNLTYSNFDTHTFIEKLMCIYNCEVSEYLDSANKKLVFRSQEPSCNFQSIKTDDELNSFLNIIQNNSAIYTFSKQSHHSLQLDKYTHATSPIRRYVDIYNQHLLFNNLELPINLEEINQYTQNIKKADRLFQKIKFQYILNEGNHKHLVYIYQYEDNKISIYLPIYKLSIRLRLIEKKIEHLYTIKKNVSTSEIIIINNQVNNVSTLKMFNKLNCEIYCINNSIYPKFKIIF